MQEYAAPDAHAANSAAQCGSDESRGGGIRQEGCQGLLGLRLVECGEDEIGLSGRPAGRGYGGEQL